MNIYTTRPPQIETTRTLGNYVTAIHMDIRELTTEEFQAAFPDGLPAPAEEFDAPDTYLSGQQTAWTATDYFLYHDTPNPDPGKVKDVIDAHINAKTDQRILSGFVWNGKNVWLSDENQRNFSEAQRAAMITNGASLPMTFKLGEDAQKNPIYHEFTTVEELTSFYLSVVAYINQCLNEGWREKDANLDVNGNE